MRALIKKAKTYLFYTILFFILSIGTNAKADLVLNTQIDWSTLNIQGYDLGGNGSAPTVTYSWLSHVTRADAWKNDGYWHASVGFTDPSSETSAIEMPFPWMMARAKSNGTNDTTKMVSARIMVNTSSLDLSPGEWAGSYADAERGGQFTVSGSGLVIFSVNYSLDAQVTPGTHLEGSISMVPGMAIAENVAQDESEYEFSIDDENGWYAESGDPIEIDIEDLLNGSLSRTGVLTVSRYFNDGDTGYFGFSVDSGLDFSPTAAPIPSALLLFAPGLLCLIGVRKSTQNR